MIWLILGKIICTYGIQMFVLHDDMVYIICSHMLLCHANLRAKFYVYKRRTLNIF